MNLIGGNLSFNERNQQHDRQIISNRFFIPPKNGWKRSGRGLKTLEKKD
jgi:hypothetical protein